MNEWSKLMGIKRDAEFPDRSGLQRTAPLSAPGIFSPAWIRRIGNGANGDSKLQKFYEIFLAWHVFFFLLAMVGCILHIWYRYAWQWGYENWIYMALAIWGFSRLLVKSRGNK